MTNEKKPRKPLVLIAAIVLLSLLILGTAASLLLLNSGDTARLPDSGVSGIRYERNVVEIKGDSGFSQPPDDTRIPLHYAAGATSRDGVNFKCVLGNPKGAAHDVYFDIYADAECTERIYLSGLVAPGTQLESFKSEKRFPEGNTDVVLVVTKVGDDHETLIAQTAVVLTLIVK